MQDQITNVVPEIPGYVQAILNSLAFLIAATTMWYGYFVRGKKKSESPVIPTSPTTPSVSYFLDPLIITKFSSDLDRITTSIESIAHTMQNNAMEDEINRRLRERLKTMKQD